MLISAKYCKWNKNNSNYSYILTGSKLAITNQEINFGMTVNRFLETSDPCPWEVKKQMKHYEFLRKG